MVKYRAATVLYFGPILMLIDVETKYIKKGFYNFLISAVSYNLRRCAVNHII